MLFLWFYHACRRASPRFSMVADHVNYLTFEDPGAVNTVRRALKLAQAGDLLGAAETAGVDIAHAAIVSEGLRRGMRFSIGAEIDNDPRARPDAQNIVEAMRPDGIIRSVHFVPIQHPEKGADWLWPFDNEEYSGLYDVVGVDKLWELYIAKLLDDIEKLPTHIVGHFYVPAKCGKWPANKRLEEYEDRMLDVAHRRGLAVEVNTRFLYRNHPEERKKRESSRPTPGWCERRKPAASDFAIGSDAHSPKDQGNAFDQALKLLDDARVNELVFPVGGRLSAVALRATREHLEAQATARRQPSAPGSSITGYGRAELGLPEEAELAGRQGGRTAREIGPKKRPSASTRVTKRPTAPLGASTSRRSASRLPPRARRRQPKWPNRPSRPRRKKPRRRRPQKRATPRRLRPSHPLARRPDARRPRANRPQREPQRSLQRVAHTKPKPHKAGYAKKSVKKKTAAKRR